MSRLGKITRRTLLIGSAAMAGGVAFGAWRLRTDYPNPLKDGLAEGEAAITPYVLIAPDGITLITPRADKGQGAYSVQAALIAEELDVRLDQIRVDPGPPDKTYWNEALAAESAEFVAPGGGVMNTLATASFKTVMKTMGMQLTGGSTTVPDAFVKLREAGAVARETLKQVAAQREGVDRALLTTSDGHVILPDGHAVRYEDLASEAALVEPVGAVSLRDPAEWKILGKPMQRIDIVKKSTGAPIYGIDLEIEDMVHAAVRLNPAIGGSVGAVDARAALALPGVRDHVPVTGGVAVLADHTWAAFEGARALEVEWGESPLPATMDGHWQALADSFTDKARDSRNRDDGDVEAALAGDAAPVTAEYRAPYLAHAPLEPLNAIVRIDEDGAEVWTGTQVPRFVQQRVAKIAGCKADQVKVHVLMMGGSFGHRLETAVVDHCAEIAVQIRGTPVKLTYSREEDMTHDFPRQIAMARLRGRVAEGKVEAMDLGIAMPSVMSSQMGRVGVALPGPDSMIVAGAWEQPFALPHQRVTGYRAGELAPISSWRSVGASTNGFFYNAALDELIEAAGADPLEERLRLCNDPLARKVLEAVGEMAGWSGARPGAGRGRGVALTRSFGVDCAEIVEVAETPEGLRITDVWVAAEVGRVLDPVNFENNVQGAVIWGLGHAINCEITYENGRASPDNFWGFEGMRLYQTPRLHVRGLENGEAVRGVGEPPVPPAAPALAGAIHAITGQRLREMPFSKFVTFA